MLINFWPWLSEFSGVVLTYFSLDYFHGCIAHKKPGRLVQAVVQGNSSFSVMGQETCEHSAARYLARSPTKESVCFLFLSEHAAQLTHCLCSWGEWRVCLLALFW